MRSCEGYCDAFPRCEPTREIKTKLTIVGAHWQFITTVHMIFHFLHDMTPWTTIKEMIVTERHRASLSLVTFWWWRHSELFNTFDNVAIGFATHYMTRNLEHIIPLMLLAPVCNYICKAYIFVDVLLFILIAYFEWCRALHWCMFVCYGK